MPTATSAYTQQDGASLRPTPGGSGIAVVDRAGHYALRLSVDQAAGGTVAATLALLSDLSSTERGRLFVDTAMGSDAGAYALAAGDVLTLGVTVANAAAAGAVAVTVTVRAGRLS